LFGQKVGSVTNQQKKEIVFRKSSFLGRKSVVFWLYQKLKASNTGLFRFSLYKALFGCSNAIEVYLKAV
jgi:hypothetical protein